MRVDYETGFGHRAASFPMSAAPQCRVGWRGRATLIMHFNGPSAACSKSTQATGVCRGHSIATDDAVGEELPAKSHAGGCRGRVCEQ